jgi:hypothetical protein
MLMRNKLRKRMYPSFVIAGRIFLLWFLVVITPFTAEVCKKNKYTDHESCTAHSRGEYSRGNAHTNTIEGYFSIFKRGMIGTYHKCGEQHLKRYAVEFDFRYKERAPFVWTVFPRR